MLDTLLILITKREKDLNRSNRISLLALLSDAWVEKSNRIMSRNDLNSRTGPIDLDKVVKHEKGHLKLLCKE